MTADRSAHERLDLTAVEVRVGDELIGAINGKVTDRKPHLADVVLVIAGKRVALSNGAPVRVRRETSP